MASQLQLAYGQSIKGIALLGAGPFYCSQGELQNALGPCVEGGNLRMSKLTHYARDEAAAGRLATLNHLDGLRVWVFHGSQDTTIHPDVSYAAVEFYEELADSLTTRFVEDIPAGHGFPTVMEGHKCSDSESPFLLACDYDAAGELLRFLLNSEVVTAERASGTLTTIAQSSPELADEAYVYIPKQCEHQRCGLHIALHGCEQSAQRVGQRFVADAGYNRWADALNLIVLYPQIKSSRAAPVNPLGCWDSWGYTGDNFANRKGPQIKALAQLVETISGQPLF